MAGETARSQRADAPRNSMDVLGLILERGRVGPHHAAAKDAVRDLTYEELGAEVAEVAAGLGALGVETGDRVALYIPNSVDFLVAALACLWVGAAFVPLATTDPESRTTAIIENCDPTLVLSADHLDGSANGAAASGRRRRSMSEVVAIGAGSAIPTRAEQQRNAYAIYTSGTTGTPKGVLIGSSAFTAAVLTTQRLLGLSPSTRALCVSPFHFDGSFGTLFPTVVGGGLVVIPPRESLLFPQRFFQSVANESINFTGCSPTYLRLLLASPRVSRLADTPLALIALGGEACSAADVDALWRATPRLRVFNRYGPTETTIAVTHCELDRQAVAAGRPVPIGRPHPGVTFYLVDEEGAVIDAAGVVGELYIGGVQLMEGYWREPALTDEVIRTDVVAGERLYRSGDLVYRDDVGNYVYVDRANQVIKRSGVRISLVEVAEALRNIAGISAATCVAFDNEGQTGIAAFVVAIDGLEPREIRRAASEHLPSTMLPDLIKTVEVLPLTSVGKVDDRRLLQMADLAPR